MKSMYSTEIYKHSFARNVIEKLFPIKKVIEEPETILSEEIKYNRLLDEHEYYVICVGDALAQLTSTFRQLEHIIFYLSTFTPTKRMKEHSINRHDHLLYQIENFFIRSQSIYNRMLKLVDNVFHIGNNPHNISHNVIISNFHVKQSDIENSIKNFKKLTKSYKENRDTIIHRKSYRDEDLIKLGAYYGYLDLMLVQEDEDPAYKNMLNFLTKETLKKLIRDKTKEFEEFNEKAFNSIKEIFDQLENKFNNKEKELRTQCRKK